jgi:hypothetical protein
MTCLVRLATKIVQEGRGKILRVPVQAFWTVGDYVEEGKYRGYLVVGIAHGRAVLFR